MWVGQCGWPFLCGGCEDLAVEGTEGWGASFCSLAAFPPRELARSVGSEGASPKSPPRLNQTCFCTGAKGGHSATGVCGEGGYPSASVRTLLLCI